MESLKEKKIMKKELVDLALFENEWWQKTTDGFAPLRQIPRVVSTDVEYEDDGTDHPRGYPTLIYEKSTLPGHRGLERADHQRSTYQVTDQEFRIKVEEDTNPHGNPDIKPETQASPASGDDGLGSWVVVHWNFIPEGDVAERIRQDSMTRLATQFDRTFYDMISRWEQNVELRFQVVEVEERDDELQAYEDDEQDNTDTVVGTAAFAALAAEVDDFLDDLGFELGIQNKRKRESEVDVDIEVNKRPRSQSLSTEPDFSSWYR
ncbi:hypothetical protein CALCODRAFT_491514 [Calocera cornea HHB12733]|uniref:Uncharacterized protein n=1 Tax=Calocera cornea HHB12733 TaxID=1353952 RepID=A0A165IYC2_9BASI|nr:hypothetical protein CALCODRAFT_491514 [Calocera cornea HHB12733]